MSLDYSVRNDFSGDECISDITGDVTKHYEISYTFVIFLLSTVILLFLLCCVVGSFFAINEYKNHYQNSAVHKILAGFLNGASITILNTIYTGLTLKFVNLENHKYESTFEKSFIVKSWAFKIINSYFALMYTAYYLERENYKDIFYLLFPLVVNKQISTLVGHVNFIKKN